MKIAIKKLLKKYQNNSFVQIIKSMVQENQMKR